MEGEETTAVENNDGIGIDIEANIEETVVNPAPGNNVLVSSDVPPPIASIPKKHIRTDPVKALEARKRRLERQAALMMPEIHFVGEIVGGTDLLSDFSEGAFCRYKIDCGKAWEHLDGDLIGQTHVAYCATSAISSSAMMPFNHPIDCHFAEAGLQGWGNIRIAIQCYRLDWCGRRILSGYGFTHLPSSPGHHSHIQVPLWRPSGSPDEELNYYLLGHTHALLTHDPIYETAWRERCRLVTVSAGSVWLDLFVVTRNLTAQGVN